MVVHLCTTTLRITTMHAQRAAHGIPAHVREHPRWPQKCPSHIAYMKSTGTFGHSEDPASPAYSAAGNWAGENSVLAKDSSWPTGDPFAQAPIHLIQLMSPELRQAGIDVSSGYVCVTTWPGHRPSGRKKPTGVR